MKFTDKALQIFNRSIEDYHVLDTVEQEIKNPFQNDSLEQILYKKNWIDTVQWHLEDIIRDENICPTEALIIKRKIDASNQHRTDLVEHIDQWFLERYNTITPNTDATLNTETIAWAIDRLSILCLKIFHMKLETVRSTASQDHKNKCTAKLNVLLEQLTDLSEAIEQLIENIEKGKVKMKTYKQMKMYNDESLNPILYKKDIK